MESEELMSRTKRPAKVDTTISSRAGKEKISVFYMRDISSNTGCFTKQNHEESFQKNLDNEEGKRRGDSSVIINFWYKIMRITFET